jgi:hypothetical protein
VEDGKGNVEVKNNIDIFSRMGRITRKYRYIQRGGVEPQTPGLFSRLFGRKSPNASVPGTKSNVPRNSKIVTGLEKGLKGVNLASKLAATSAASTVFGKNQSKSVSSGLEGVDFTLKVLKVAASKKFKHEKDKADTVKAQSELVSKAATYAHTYLPKILQVAGAVSGVAGIAAIGSSGIGVPIVVAGLIVVSMYLKHKGLNLKLRELLIEHQEKLLSILRMFLIIQRVILTMKVPYVKYDKATKQSTGEQGLATLKISPEFQEAVSQYMLLVKARTPPDPTSAWYKRAFLSTKKFFSAGSTIDSLTSLFTKILDSFHLEAAKFNLLIPFNTTEFNAIKDKIKTSSQYTDLVEGFSSKKSSCGDNSDPEAVCNLSEEELGLEFQNVIDELNKIVSEDELMKAGNVTDMIDQGAEEIQTETLTEMVEDQANNPQEANTAAEKQIESTVQNIVPSDEESLDPLPSNNAGSNNAGSNNAGSNNAGSNNAGSNNAGSNNAGSNNAGSNNAGAYNKPSAPVMPTEISSSNLRRTRRRKYKQRR